MGYDIFVECDNEGCGAREQVSQLNAVPRSWVQLMHALPQKSSLDKNLILQQQQLQPIGKLFCGWRCVTKYAKGFLNGSD